MIRIENLSKVYSSANGEVNALKNINIDIKKGEVFGIIGLSGAGKSTLIRTINRLEEPTSGQIFIDDKEITKFNKEELRNIRKKIGMIFQHFNLLSSRTVFNNIAFPLEIEGYKKNEIEERVDELLSVVGLLDKKNTYPSQLSGGQKQRVAIARSLVINPDILLCDEATSALDPKTTKSILKLLKDIQVKFGLTIVLITHQMEVIREICDRVAIIENGEIIEMNTIEEIFSSPKTKTAKEFISNIHHSDQERIIYPKVPDSKVVRLSFMGENSRKPIISRLIRNFNLDINILSGNIDELMTTSIGTLIVQFSGSNKEIDKSLQWLEDKKIGWEVIAND